jgi:prepilin-type processing-associated H-X9-DG protein
MSNLRQLAMGLVAYSVSNKGWVIPSYNLPLVPGAAEGSNNFTGGPQQPMDGWGPILVRDGYVKIGTTQSEGTVFYCPETVDVEGMKDGQTASDAAKPRGWTDWPVVFTSVGGDGAPKQAVTMADKGFDKIIRVSYWINAYNPVGSQPADIAANDVHYTSSVGLGPDTARGVFLRLKRTTGIRNSTAMITLADGLYMGRQTVTRQGDANSRIGYRHPGKGKRQFAANVAFADGHCEVILGDKFPRALSGGVSDAAYEAKKVENFSGPTVYADPGKIFTK